MGRKPAFRWTVRGRTPQASLWTSRFSGLCWRTCLARIALGGLLAATGCSSPVIRSQSPETKSITAEDDGNTTSLVRDMARPWGLRPQLLQGIGLVSQLENTGSDPPASPQRDFLRDDMQRRSVAGPDAILASPQTALVLLRAHLPAGVQKGDRLDIEVLSPSRSETESLRDGWLMAARLQEMAVLGNRLRQGRLMGMAEGSLIVDSLLESESDARSETRGRILGGAVSMADRSLGLVLLTEHHSVRASSLLGTAINNRFHTYDRGTKRGVATPKRDNFIELAVYSRYRKNLVRYVRVVQAIPVRETPRELMDRLETLEERLMDSQTAMSAAVDLEAIGPEALPTLQKGLKAGSPLVRFAAAEALAYMNEEVAVKELVDAVRREPAFRWHALTALSAMTKSTAREGMAELLHEASDETRYGAFQALIDFNPRDPAVQGAVLRETMTLHKVPSRTDPLVHVRRSDRPEIVIFGQDVQLRTPAAVFAGKRILVKSEGNDRLKVSSFSLGHDDRTEYCVNELAAMIRTVVQIGGSYADVVAALNDAKQKGVLTARVKFDALPKPGREYSLEDEEIDELPEGFDPTTLEEDEDALLDPIESDNDASV